MGICIVDGVPRIALLCVLHIRQRQIDCDGASERRSLNGRNHMDVCQFRRAIQVSCHGTRYEYVARIVVVLRNSSGRRINYGVIVCLLRVQKARYVGYFPRADVFAVHYTRHRACDDLSLLCRQRFAGDDFRAVRIDGNSARTVFE